MEKLTRQDRLRGWLKMHRISVNLLAELLGAKACTVSALLIEDKIPEWHVERLRKVRSPVTGEAIPEDLLPRASDGKRGPRKGWLDDLKAKAALADQGTQKTEARVS